MYVPFVSYEHRNKDREIVFKLFHTHIFEVTVISLFLSQIVKTYFGLFVGSSSELLKEN
jgi:hypothetical protein